MKKAMLIFGIIFGLFLIALVAVPFIYKDKIVDIVKREANKNLEATLDFRSIDLNLFENFPNFTLNLTDLTLVNKAPFAGDTLLALDNFQTTIDLKSIFRGEVVKIVAIRLDRPDIRLRVLKDSSVNWDIAKKTEETAPATAEQTTSDFKLALQSYEIRQGTIHFQNDSSGLSVNLSGFDHLGSGDFSSERFQLRTMTNIAALSAGIPGAGACQKRHVSVPGAACCGKQYQYRATHFEPGR